MNSQNTARAPYTNEKAPHTGQAPGYSNYSPGYSRNAPLSRTKHPEQGGPHPGVSKRAPHVSKLHPEIQARNEGKDDLETRINKTNGISINKFKGSVSDNPLFYPGKKDTKSYFTDGNTAHTIKYRKKGKVNSGYFIRNGKKENLSDYLEGRTPVIGYGSLTNIRELSNTVGKNIASIKGKVKAEPVWNLKTKGKVGGMAELKKNTGAETKVKVAYASKNQLDELMKREKHYRMEDMNVQLETGENVTAKVFMGKTNPWKKDGKYVGIREAATTNRTYPPMTYKQALKTTITDYLINIKFRIKTPKQLLDTNKDENLSRKLSTHIAREKAKQINLQNTIQYKLRKNYKLAS